uniref:DUF6818 domain-containing protein n=1 Tax=Phytophthora ramorum TaxID=164328 RepID=H3GL63_PHYRM
MRHRPAAKLARGGELFAQLHHVVACAVGYATTSSTAAGAVTTSLRTRRERRQPRREDAAPYARHRAPTEQAERRADNPAGRSSTAPVAGDEQYNPMGIVFPTVAHFGWCACVSPCRTETCRNALMNVYCNISCCPYDGLCGNGLVESTKLCMMRNARKSSLCVVAAEDIDAGEVLGQYLGEMDLVRPYVRDQPRNRGYRLVMKMRPASPVYPVRVVINAEFMGGMMSRGGGGMVKLTGGLNYKMAEITRLLKLVEEYLPLGKDEWERLSVAYKTSRSRTLRRKFKALYSTRKQTGAAEMPPHIEKAKWAKQAIDDKANVVKMNDAADEDQDDNEGKDERYVEPDFSFELYFNEEDDRSDTVLLGSDQAGSTNSGSDETCSGERSETAVSNAGISLSTLLPSKPSDAFDLQLGDEDLEAFATPKPAPLPAAPAPRQLRSAGLQKPRATANSRVNVAVAAATFKANKLPAAGGYEPGTRDGEGSLPPQNPSNVDSKRSRDAGVNEEDEASFAKAKRLRVLKSTTALKKKLTDLKSASSNIGTSTSTFKMMLLFRVESERKSEARRVEEELRRRDEAAAKDARLQAEKLEAEERRRQDKLEADERLRRDKEDARARTQEMIMLIGAIFKKE